MMKSKQKQQPDTDGVHAALYNVLALQEQIKEQAKQRYSNIEKKIGILEKEEKKLFDKIQSIKKVIKNTSIYSKKVQFEDELAECEKEYTDIIKDKALHLEALEIFKVKGLV